MSSRERLVWAFVFSIPVGIGVSSAIAVSTGGDSLVSVLAGLFTMVVLFGFVLLVSITGETDEEASGALQVGEKKD